MQHFVIQQKENGKFIKFKKFFYTCYTLPMLKLGKRSPRERVSEGKGFTKSIFFKKKKNLS